MKLWNKSSDVDSKIESFTIGNDPEYDMLLASYDIQGSKAHAEMLEKAGFLSGAELEAILEGLDELLIQVENGQFKIDAGVEDIHSQVEFSLIQMIGEPGKKLHLARSRNDQIAVDLKLYYRDQLSGIKAMVIELINSLISKAESTQDILMPGYTHSQAGMVSSFGLWYGSFAEALVDDLKILNVVAEVVDQNPLGSAAGYGSSFPIDRGHTTSELGFTDVAVNSIYAQASRGRGEYNIAFALSNIALTINRLAGDLCLYSNENYAFMKLPDALTTGSSIMPHKRNPDVMELVRAKCNQITTLPVRVQNLLVNMQTGYHRDYQLFKEVLFPELTRIQEIIDIVIYCIPLIQERKDILEEERYIYCYTVENINHLVSEGMAFRDAYHQVKEEVNQGTFEPVTKRPKHTHLGSIGNPGFDELRRKLKDLF
jgi:argininosuccinate lyase